MDTKPESTSIAVRGIAHPDGLPYSKADMIKMSRLGESFALVFYQFDYLALAHSLNEKDFPYPPEAIKPVTVSKIVMDEEGLDRFFFEVNLFKEVWNKYKDAQKAKQGS